MRWAIGDVHGMLRPLRALVDAIAKSDPAGRLFFAGDYINRGPESAGVIDFLLALDNARFIRGNHDDVFDLILGGRAMDPHLAGNDRLYALRWFSEFGVLDTFASYGIPAERLSQVCRNADLPELDRLIAAVPASHRAFLAALEPVIEQPDCFIAHAKWPIESAALGPGIAAALAARPGLSRILLWGRFTSDELFDKKSWGKRGYFGHTPVDVYMADDAAVPLPLFADHMTLIDTGAALFEHGRLTAVCLDTHAVIQSDRAGIIHSYQGPPPDPAANERQ